MGPGYDDQGDMNDSAPLLNHAQPTFGLPHNNSGYTLRDDGMGDMGMRASGPGYPNGSFNGQPPADDERNNVHYGPVPTRVVRRNRTQKRVK
jgi:chitin synthase